MTDTEKQEMQQMIAALLPKPQDAQPSPFAAPVVSPFANTAPSAIFTELEVDLELRANDGTTLTVRGKLPHPENVTPANIKDTISAYIQAGWSLKFWSPKSGNVGKKF
jgi:hypothetical protein